MSCPPLNASAGEIPGTCLIGDLPRYTVNATRPEHISAGILFAQEHNIRLVIKDTGHDILGRSNGFGSFETLDTSFEDRYRTPKEVQAFIRLLQIILKRKCVYHRWRLYLEGCVS
ncbi:hypothetical protein GJ744_000054 [Endocarpon pusillum]|uniref:Uncharacterized protein n=1 Tax=Endocarpon pusillum TaxID=364733 RepID=A0A8H7E8G3_9EURO|nr:hypothetical protein GJ744_000054 [Endocarpon pusillum]